jgi:hypothetical protein
MRRTAFGNTTEGKVTEQIVVGTPGTLIAKLKHNEVCGDAQHNTNIANNSPSPT